MDNISKIIRADEVMESLVTGFEVLLIKKDKVTKYGVYCEALTGEKFSIIEKMIAVEDPNVIYIKTIRIDNDQN